MSWLSDLGASVCGLSLDPPSGNLLYHQAGVAPLLAHDIRGDIRKKDVVEAAIRKANPEIVFHLAAQSLVSEGYTAPIETYETNVLGTGNVLLACFDCPSIQAIVAVATDKCYENSGWVHPYRESDRLGGADPYSSSKACSEILVHSFRESFSSHAKVASARAGNVIGGGDWAQNRLIPDCVRSFSNSKPVVLRRPHAVRPWQWVLEPLLGYLLLAEKLMNVGGKKFAGPWNFGPSPGKEATVIEVAQTFASLWGASANVKIDLNAAEFEEAAILRLDSTKAQVELEWCETLSNEQRAVFTADWYRAWHKGEDLRQKTKLQIKAFEDLIS